MNIVSKMQIEFYRWAIGRYDILSLNTFFKTCTEMDLYGIRPSGYSDEIEIKLTKSDYLADFKKLCMLDDGENQNGKFKKREELKHTIIKEGRYHCNYFSFLMTEDLARNCTIPDYAGLYIYNGNSKGFYSIKEEKKPRRMHNNKVIDRTRINIGNKMAHRFWLLKRMSHLANE